MRKALLWALTLGVAASSAAAAEPVTLAGSTPAGLTEPSRMDTVTRILLEFGAAPERPRPTAFPAQAAAPIALGFRGAAEAVGSGASQRIQLSASAMDMITAGLVSVDVTAAATAQGPGVSASTSTETHATGGRWIQVAYGRGNAHAAGEDAAVDVGMSLYGEGDYVIGATSRTVVGAPGYARGHTAGFVIALNLTRGRHKEDERVAQLLAQGYAEFVDFVERGYERLAEPRRP